MQIIICKEGVFFMKRYIALLRGINISGKNKISMSLLKSYFIELGYTNIFTYLNSGNIVFSVNESREIDLADKIGEPTIELEQICICKNAIFWSFDRKKYAKANWWKKTASKGISEMITIRTSKTLKKIAKT